jgi:hypothetical protein
MLEIWRKEAEELKRVEIENRRKVAELEALIAGSGRIGDGSMEAGAKLKGKELRYPKEQAGSIEVAPKRPETWGLREKSLEWDSLSEGEDDKDEEGKMVGEENESELSPPANAGFTKVWGTGMCSACKKFGGPCRINVEAISEWREAVKNGKMFKRCPARTSCWNCASLVHQVCDFPGTADLRGKMGNAPKTNIVKSPGQEMGRALLTSSIGTKRKAGVEVVEGGVRQKRTRREVEAVEKKEGEGELVRWMREGLGEVGGKYGEEVEMSRRVADGVERMGADMKRLARGVEERNEHIGKMIKAARMVRERIEDRQRRR